MKTTNICVEVGPMAESWYEPVTAQSVYDHANLNCGLEAVETQLEDFITAARKAFEADTDGRICLPTFYRQYFTEWPDVMRLDVGPVSEIVSVTYFDTDGEEQELAGYETDIRGVPALVHVPGFSYPALSTDKLRPICVEFVAGWANPESVPTDIKQALRVLAAHFYEYRETQSVDSLKELDHGFQRICNRYRTGLKGF